MNFGPDQLPAALVLTFDNLGEASELEQGTWPAGAALGSHPSVTDALPRLLDELEADGLSATFFVEAINCELYPDAVLEIGRRGHELGLHGWRHEQWGSLPVEDERGLLARGMRAFGSLGIEARGFRPPGGALTPHSPELLREAGFDWCSPAGSGAGVRGGLSYVPFEWELVDAYHLMARFAASRERRGDGAEPANPRALVSRLARELDGVPESGRQRTLILHPFLMLDPAWLSGVHYLLGRIRALALGGRTWVVSGGTFAHWLLSLPEPPQPVLESG
jgi:hypothetical protein